VASTPKIDFSPNSAVQNVSPELDTTGSLAERKTSSNPAEPTIISSKAINVLSTLKSYTYNFTIACLSPTEIGVPESYTNKALPRIILSSSGKTSIMSEGDTSSSSVESNNLLESFNKNSSGRFNLYMDNLEIKSVLSFTELGGTTQPTTFTFDVFEPYSVNGFLQTLSVAAITAGWNSYSEAAFILLIEFRGYPDGDTITSPITLKEKRYIPFKLTNTGVEITEKGTQYKCSAVSWSDTGFGHAGRLPSAIAVTGDTLGDILQDLMNKLNTQLDKNSEKDNGASNSTKHDYYNVRIESPEIEKAKVIEIDKDITAFAFLDPQTVPDGNQNYPDNRGRRNVLNANNSSLQNIQFNTNENLYEVISNLVVTSTYIRGVIKSLYETNGAEAWSDPETGMVKYFSIKIETEENGRNEIKNVPLRIYTYVISPFEIHYTSIPEFAKLGINQSKLFTQCVRTYKYLYTGENRELLSFRLNYDHLFYEGMPRARGTNEQPTQEARISPTQDTEPVQTGKVVSTPRTLGDPTASVRNDPTAETDNKLSNGILRQDDPYFALAYNLHKAVIKPQSSLATAEIEILGDPFYLVTGGIGNQPNAADEIAARSKSCFINVQFKNPDDIGLDGFISYNQTVNDPFHGAYQVTLVLHTFKEGVFKQKLSLVRVAGQDPTNSLNGNPSTRITTVGGSNPAGSKSQDTRSNTNISTPGNGSLSLLTGIGFPTLGSNFPNRPDGLGTVPPSQSQGISNLANLGLNNNNLGVSNQLSPVQVNINSLSTPQSNIDVALGISRSSLPSYIYNPTTQLAGLSGGGLSGRAESAINSIGNAGANVNLVQAVDDGVSFKYLSNLDIPASQPRTSASLQAPLSVDDLRVASQGGLDALAKTRGVSVSELSSVLTNQVVGLTNSVTSPLAKLNNALRTG